MKTPRHLGALSFTMGFCLLVYAFGQHYLRQGLAQAEATLPYLQVIQEI